MSTRLIREGSSSLGISKKTYEDLSAPTLGGAYGSATQHSKWYLDHPTRGF